jgi:hypothetical protein
MFLKESGGLVEKSVVEKEDVSSSRATSERELLTTIWPSTLDPTP